MTSPSRATAALAAVLLTSTLSLAAPTSALAAPTGVAGAAGVDLIHVDALEFPGTLDVADVAVSPAAVVVDYAGIAGGSETATARAANLDVDVLSGALPLSGLIVEATQAAPPRNETPNDTELVTVPLSPIASATVARAIAHAPGYGTACPPLGEPIATATSFVADPNVVPDGSGSGLVSAANGGGTVSTNANVSLVEVEGQGTRAVQATATTQLTQIDIAGLVRVNVLAPPVVTATATGTPGTATVTYSEPVLQIVDPTTGAVLGELNGTDGNTTFDALAPVLTLSVGTLVAEIADDGTSASGSAVLLDIALLSGAPIPGTAVHIAIAGGNAAAAAPVGGVLCPDGETPTGDPLAGVRKYPTSSIVQPGATFDYVLNVPNQGPCTLTDVTVTDVISGPPGTSVVATTPDGAAVDGLTVTWSGQGPIAPGESLVYRVTVQVPADAPAGAKLSDTLTVTADCDGTPVDHDVTVDLPEVGDMPNSGCSLAGSNKASTHLEVVRGQQFTYLVQLLNSGDQPCTGIAVTDTLPAGTTFVACSDGCTNTGQDVNWSVANLAAGAGRTLTVTVEVDEDASGSLPNVATADPANGTPVKVTDPGPKVTDESVPAPPKPALPRVDELPATGGGLAFGALGLLGGAGLLRRGWRP